MNRSLIITLLLLLVTCDHVIAQDTTETKNVFSNGPEVSTKNLGVFLAPSYGLTSIDRSTTSIFNLRGGAIFKDRFSTGLYFARSVNEIYPQSETIQGVYMDYWTFGAFSEYTLFSNKLMHFTFPIYIGYGEVEMDNENGNAGLGEANFFQLEPGAMLEINLFKNARLNVGLSHRFVSRMEYQNFNQSAISGFTGYIGLKFGVFR